MAVMRSAKKDFIQIRVTPEEKKRVKQAASFAQMDMMQKAEISHRGIAVKKLVNLL